MEIDRVEHLKLVQGVITRMAGNTFYLKGWTVTLVVALLAVAAKETHIRFSVIALVPALAFWGLDAYYLRQERLFRKLYDHVRQAPGEELGGDPYSLSTDAFNGETGRGFCVLWTGPVVGLHGVVVAGLLAAIVVLALFKAGVLVLNV